MKIYKQTLETLKNLMNEKASVKKQDMGKSRQNVDKKICNILNYSGNQIPLRTTTSNRKSPRVSDMRGFYFVLHRKSTGKIGAPAKVED